MSFRTFSHEGVRHVVVENLGSGSCTVEAGTTDNVEGTLNAGPEVLEAISVRLDHDILRIECPQTFFRNDSIHIRLDVPPDLRFIVRAGSADIAITAPIGRSTIRSGSGDVRLSRAADVDCASGSGDLTVAEAAGSRAKLSSGSGDITVEQAHCPVSAKTGSGTVTVRAVHRTEVQASSGSGDIAVPSTSGSVDLRSASGSLTVGVADGLPAWLDLHSVSGRVRIAMDTTTQPGPGDPFVSIRARTASGEIAVFRG